MNFIFSYQDHHSTMLAPSQLPHSSRHSTKQLTAEEDDVDTLALETVRLLKLFYFCVVEHVRSTDGSCGAISARRGAISKRRPR